MARFADILARVKVAEEDREAITAITGKYPELDSAIADAQELQAARANLEQTNSQLKQWKGTPDSWFEKAWDPEHGMTKAQWAAEERLRVAEAKVAEMAAGGSIGDGTMTFEEIDAHLKAGGYVKASDVAGLAKVDDVKKELSQQGSNYEFLYTKTAHLPLKAMKEFGDVDDKFLPGLFQLMISDPSGELLKDPEKAYQQYVAPMRLEADRRKFEADKAAFETQKTEDAAKKAAAPSPTDTEAAGNVAPYQQREDHPGDNPIDKVKGDIPFGSGQYGRRLAEAYKAGDLKPAVN